MGAHNYIYLGRERGKRVIHKVGQTTQTCWARCKNSDYLIGVGVDIVIPAGREYWYTLNEIEQEMLTYFRNRFAIEHGLEYFRTKGYYWEDTKDIFLAKLESILKRRGLKYTIYEGWVEPYTY
jgi:hypothetical protein